MVPMDAPKKKERLWDFDRVFRLLLTIATLVAFFGLVRYLSDVLIPFAIALLLAYLLNPIVNALESRLNRRTPAVFITVIGCGIVTFALTSVLVYIGGKEIASMRNLLQEFVQSPSMPEVEGVGQAFNEFVEEQENPVVKSLLQELQAKLATEDVEGLEVTTIIQKIVHYVAPGLVNVVTGTLSFLLGLTGVVVVLLYLVFLLIDYRLMANSWKSFLPPKYREDIVGFVDEFGLAMSRYFRGQFIIAFTVGILFAIGFKILGLRMAILLGLGVGMLNMVPYLQTVGLIPALLLGLVRDLEANRALWISAVAILGIFAVCQLIQDALLTPKIMGKSVGLRPVTLLLGIFIWGKLLGFLGLVLAIPFTCLGVAYYKRFVLGDKNAQAVQPE